MKRTAKENRNPFSPDSISCSAKIVYSKKTPPSEYREMRIKQLHGVLQSLWAASNPADAPIVTFVKPTITKVDRSWLSRPSSICTKRTVSTASTLSKDDNGFDAVRDVGYDNGEDEDEAWGYFVDIPDQKNTTTKGQQQRAESHRSFLSKELRCNRKGYGMPALQE